MKQLVRSSFKAGRLLVLVLLPLFLYNKTEAQGKESITLSKVNLYADFGGHLAGQASLNFEYQISSGENITWYGRAGLGAAGVIMAGGGPGGLAAITMLTGKGRNHFELNGGAFFMNSDDIAVLPLLDLGYRYQKPEGGFIFKAKVGILGIGIGLGYAF